MTTQKVSLGGMGLSRNAIAVKIGKHEVMINFKTGGDLTLGETITAHAGRGLSGTGLYEATVVDGDAVISRDLYRTLVTMYQEDKFVHFANATHFKYVSYDGGLSVKTMFNNCVLHKLPEIALTEHGAEASMKMIFSLSDPVEVTVENADKGDAK